MNSIDMDTPVPFTKRHSDQLDRQEKMLGEHDKVLGEHSKVLGEHGKVLGEHTKMLIKHGDEIHRVGLLLEDNIKKSDLILDAVLGMQARFDRFESLDKRTTSLEHRVSAVETVLKDS